MPLGQLVLIVLALLAATGYGRPVLATFGLSAAAAALICFVAALGSSVSWVLPVVPPVRVDAGSGTLLLAALGTGWRVARRHGAAAVSRYGTALLVTVTLALVWHRFGPHEAVAGIVLDARTGLLLASGLTAAVCARQPALACSAAAAAFAAVVARDWVLLQRAGFTAVPLAVGGDGLNLLVLTLACAGIGAAALAVVSDDRLLSAWKLPAKGGEPR